MIKVINLTKEYLVGKVKVLAVDDITYEFDK